MLCILSLASSLESLGKEQCNSATAYRVSNRSLVACFSVALFSLYALRSVKKTRKKSQFITLVPHTRTRKNSIDIGKTNAASFTLSALDSDTVVENLT